MKKQKTTFKHLLSLALVFVLAFSMVLPSFSAFAATTDADKDGYEDGPFTITIEPGPSTATPDPNDATAKFEGTKPGPEPTLREEPQVPAQVTQPTEPNVEDYDGADDPEYLEDMEQYAEDLAAYEEYEAAVADHAAWEAEEAQYDIDHPAWEANKNAYDAYMAANATNTLVKRFTAYSIFTGDVIAGEDEDWAAPYTPTSEKLANVKWAKGFADNAAAFIAALNGDATIKALFDKYIADNEDVDAITTAADVAGALDGAKNDAAIAFANVANAFILAQEKAGTAFDTVTSYWNGSNWIIEEDEGGYYLIVDNYPGSATEQANNKDSNGNVVKPGEVKGYILAVFGSQKVRVKSTTPEVDKDILVERGLWTEDNTKKGTDVEIGDTVDFRLTGTLPENYAQYKHFYYQFEDTLSKGLTIAELEELVKDLEVNVLVWKEVPDTEAGEGATKWVSEIQKLDYDDGYYTVEIAKNSNGTTTLKVTFKDLTAIQFKDGYKLVWGSEIYVDYQATLNGDAVIGANTNDVKLKYQNDPFDDYDGTNDPPDTSETPEKVVYVYDFALQIHKIGSDEDDQEGLEGAGFVLTKKDEDGNTLYAKFAEDDNHVKYVEKWLTEEEYKAVVANGYDGTDVVLKSLENGNLPLIKGLASGVDYTLEEVIVPSGYKKMKNVTFSYEAEYVTKADIEEWEKGEHEEGEVAPVEGTLKSLAIIVDGVRTDVDITNAKVSGGKDITEGEGSSKVIGKEYDITGTIEAPNYQATMELLNEKAPDLPSTGGIGTVIFYVAGGLLLAGAAAYLIFSGKKKASDLV